MNAATYILRSLWFHRRTHRGVWLGAAVATAVLVGALAVGDSVRYSLRAHALARLGAADVAMISADRFFRDDLAGRLAEQLKAPAAAVLSLEGVAGEAPRRANDVQVLGVDEAFWAMGKRGQEPFSQGGGSSETRGAEKEVPDSFSQDVVVLNRRLANRIGAGVGDLVMLRFNKPSLLPREAPMSLAEGYAIGRRVEVVAIADDADFGRFGLRANQIAPHNAFVPRAWLQQQVELPGRANVLLVGGGTGGPTSVIAADTALRKVWTPADAEIEIREVAQIAPRGGGGLVSPPGSGGSPNPRLPAGAIQATPGEVVQIAPRGSGGLVTPSGSDGSPNPRLPENPPLPGGAIPDSQTELRTGRIFLDAPVVEAARGTDPPPTGLLTYFVSSIAPVEKKAGLPPGTRESSPYPMVAGIGRLGGKGASPLAGYLPADLADDEIVLNGWLAEDIAAKAGEQVKLTYFVLGPARRMLERTSSFKVRAVLPMDAYTPDPTMMPEFPGIAGAERCNEWKPGLEFAPEKVNEKDQAYWDKYRGAPKAFVTLAAGRAMWSNRFGELTALRWPAKETSPSALRARLNAGLAPAEVGLFFLPVREQALAASREAMGFGGLFVGLSFFLIAAAVLLTALLFVFGVQQRSEEVGLLLAVGIRRRQVRRWLLIEGGLLALAGAAVGSLLALAYTRAVLAGLARVWSGAVAGSIVFFHVEASSVMAGAAGTIVAAMAAMWLVLWRQGRAPARVLLAGADVGEDAFRLRRWRRRGGLVVMLVGSLAAGAVLMASWSAGRAGGAVAAFFGAGSLLLIAAIGGAVALLSAVGGSSRPLTFGRLSLRNGARRSGRSVATVALLACGSFLVVAVGANRLDPTARADRKDSGTGGFKLIATAAIPVYHDLSAAAGRRALKLSEPDLAGATVVPVRVGRGDDASCLNLNRAQQPRLLAADPAALTGRFRFTKAAAGLDLSRGWELLNAEKRHLSTEVAEDTENRKTHSERSIDEAAAGGLDKAVHDNSLPSSVPSANSVLKSVVVPAIGDVDTVQWGLGRAVGDTLDYTDERGRPFKIRIAATISSSILQGSLLISERAFRELYPSSAGHAMFLVDCPPERAAGVSGALAWAGADVGLSVVSATGRLAEFAAVQNSYLSIFQALGGLGLILGSVGLGVVVLRNVLERRGELAMLRAAGFTRGRVFQLLLAEHAWLLAMGLVGGSVAAAAAVLPAVRSPGAQIPYLSLSLTVAGVLVSGLLWIALAAWSALRGDVLPALRNE